MLTLNIFSNSDNIIYNKICGTNGSRPIYPHIFFQHDFRECEITDDNYYKSCLNTRNSDGAQCIFLSVKNESSLNEFLAKLCFYTQYVPNNYREIIDEFAALLRLSTAMTASFRQIMEYYAINNNVRAYLDEQKKLYALPVTSKYEGKKIYELIRKDIIG